MNKQSIFYIDPQSMLNLAVYDYELLSEVHHFDVHYICSCHLDFKENKSHTYHKLFAYNKMNSNAAKVLSYVWSYMKVLVLMVRLRPALVHVQWLRLQHFDYWFYRMVKIFFRTKIVYTAHNILPLNDGEKYKSVFTSFYNKVDYIIVHTEDTKNQMLSLFNLADDKVRVIQHGMLHMHFDSKELERMTPDLEQKYHLDRRLSFVSLGYQNAYKGSDVLADVWSSTPELNQNSSCQLVLAGKNQGVDFSALEKFDNVMIENRRISNEEYFYLMTHASVYLLPYKKKSFSQSGALMTTISECVPVLVTNVGGLAEPMKIARIGWVIGDDADYDGLKKTLLHILHHPEEPSLIKDDKEAWAKIQNHYDWKDISCQTQKLYIEAIEA